MAPGQKWVRTASSTGHSVIPIVGVAARRAGDAVVGHRVRMRRSELPPGNLASISFHPASVGDLRRKAVLVIAGK